MKHISKMKTQIQSYYPSFTRTEKKIAQYILDNYTDIMYLSVTELADLAGVGETTVFRFCKKMGFKGYPEFKLIIAQDIVNFEEENDDNNDTYHFAEIIKNNIVNKISECYTSLDIANLNDAINYIYEAKRIFFFGTGSSGISATTAQERFMRVGITTDVALDSHRQSMVASILSKQDVIVALSLSGNTKDIIDAIEIAKENGVKIIVVTSYIRSHITKYADIVLQTAGKEHLMEGGTLVSSISQLYIVDLLVTGVSLLNKENAQYMREKTGRSILGKLYNY